MIIIVGRRKDLDLAPDPDPGQDPVAGGEGRGADRAVAEAGAGAGASPLQGPSQENLHPGVAVAPPRRRRKTIPGSLVGRLLTPSQQVK